VVYQRLAVFSVSATKRELYLLPLLPVLALLIGNYFNDLSAGTIDETAIFRWLASVNFTIVVIIGVALPAVAWIVRPEAFWIFVPGSLTLALGGAVAVRFFRQRDPLKAITSIVLMMTMLLLSSALWVFPYLEQFKSPRPLAVAIKRIVPATAPLYIYADSMSEFNYYLERDAMPLLSSPAAIEKLLGGAPTSYMLIKERDLKRLNMVAPQWVVLTRSTGSTTWNLVELKAPPAG